MQRINRIFILMLLALFSVTVNAQLKKVPQFSFVSKNDTTSFFQGLSLNFDLIGPAQQQFSDHGHYEAGIRVNILDKYFPAFEIGVGKADHVDEFNDTITFKCSAPYFRIGCDYNILKDKHDVYRLYAGGRYCFSSFNYDCQVLEEEKDDDGNILSSKYVSYTDQKATYHWLEAVFGVDAEIWRNIHLGWDLRYKRRLFKSHTQGAKPWYVPGMGKNGNTALSGRFLIMIEF